MIQNGVILNYKDYLTVDGIKATVAGGKSCECLPFLHLELWCFQASHGGPPFLKKIFQEGRFRTMKNIYRPVFFEFQNGHGFKTWRRNIHLDVR